MIRYALLLSLLLWLVPSPKVCPCTRSNPKSCTCVPGLCECDDVCFCLHPGPNCKIAERKQP